MEEKKADFFALDFGTKFIYNDTLYIKVQTTPTGEKAFNVNEAKVELMKGDEKVVPVELKVVL